MTVSLFQHRSYAYTFSHSRGPLHVACGSKAKGTGFSRALTVTDGEILVDTVRSTTVPFRVARVVDRLTYAWAIDWLPKGRTVITERGGTM